MLKEIFLKLDKLICKYFGLQAERVKPGCVKLANDQLIISSTSSFKRHLHRQNWDNFNFSSFNEMSETDKEKLGIIAGRTIAKKLTISFQDIPIKR